MKKTNITVIISSHYPSEDNEKLIKHIGDTIGCKHKVVCYSNHNQYSLSELYNKAICVHNNENTIIVFCHNDIKFKTQNWGRLLLTKFNNSDYQIIGVAGTTDLPKSGKWWDDRSKMVGIVEHTDGVSIWVSEYSKEFKGGIIPVVIIDGLFMAIDCNDIDHNFDTDFNGYHYYDLPICLNNYIDGCNIGVTTDIRILHMSIGATNQQWEENRKLFIHKYGSELPISINN